MKNDREMLQALLDDKTLVGNHGNEWILSKDGFIVHNAFDKRYPDCTSVKIKQKTIKINGFDVPEPMLEALNNGEAYYVVEVQVPVKHKIEWEGDQRDFEWLRLGLLHSTKEGAELHREALLSFTRRDENE
ncbi:MAG: hypothetical protein WC856_02360 [Methylococcaceae bacterium]|jgi:hypothetical protein